MVSKYQEFTKRILTFIYNNTGLGIAPSCWQSIMLYLWPNCIPITAKKSDTALQPPEEMNNFLFGNIADSREPNFVLLLVRRYDTRALAFSIQASSLLWGPTATSPRHHNKPLSSCIFSERPSMSEKKDWPYVVGDGNSNELHTQDDPENLPESGSQERAVAEHRLVRKLDTRLLPTIFLIFILNYIDVCSLNFA